MSPTGAFLAFGAGVLIAILIASVRVSGAVFLLPIELDALRVPGRAVTPTNLLSTSSPHPSCFEVSWGL